MSRQLFLTLVLLSVHLSGPAYSAPMEGPYDRQIDEQQKRLQSKDAAVRARAAEALGALRARRAEAALIRCLGDTSARVRRSAAIALGWCGGRRSIPPLLAALDDPDWMVAQAAHVALMNLTGMEFPFDATASAPQRGRQAEAWRRWWATVPADRPPPEVLALLDGQQTSQSPWLVTVSSVYKGPPEALIDGQIGPAFWQTKNVDFPQWCTIDLGRVMPVHQVTVYQYGPRFVLTQYELALSTDNKQFDVVDRGTEPTPVKLVIRFPERPARYVRLTSLGTVRPIYPTTLLEIQINGRSNPGAAADPASLWRRQRAVRALGALGGRGAAEAVLGSLKPPLPTGEPYRPLMRDAIAALGKLGGEAAFARLVELLEETMWARFAAEALGETGDRRAVRPLLRAYRIYAKRLDGSDPPRVPPDDKMGFPSEDRMLETPYAIAFALCRLPLDRPEDRALLRQLAPQIMANLPGDHDTHFLYEPEVGHRLTRHLLEQAGLRQEACEQAMIQLGQPRRVPPPPDKLEWPVFEAYRIASWLPAVCTDPADLPRLIALLDHQSGWVRLNAAKTLAWIGDRRAIEPLATRLVRSRPEADFGYSGRFKDEEYNDPAPRWRQGLIRALGLLKAHQYTKLIIAILNDERSVLDVRHAAAEALADLGNPEAIAALADAAEHHAFHSIRNVARDALRRYGQLPQLRPRLARPPIPQELGPLPAGPPPPAKPPKLAPLTTLPPIVFIKGSNNIPNTIGTVEQADRWRQTYVVTDSGPVYRPGRNLYLLRPDEQGGRVTPITRFADGYVGEPELDWDGRTVLFTHRGQDDPWWHIWRVGVDGSGLKQLTFGPYHDVGPAWLPDGRIVFSTSRSGIRDEYHGYPCTALWVMNPDGSEMHPIATNIGRDNEPAVLPDGRLAFSRLEVFYSRNKTELTLHAARPDGTGDMVLYGPERRAFWRNLDHGPRTPADGQEVPLTHRVLRMTQPQPMPDGRHIVVVTQGGLALVGVRRDAETIITPDNKRRAYTTPFPLPDGRLLCASTWKTPDRDKVDLGLYVLDPASRQLELVYNDPAAADFEPRPVLPRRRPPVVPPRVDETRDSGWFLCASVFHTQEQLVRQRGRLVRLIEGVPVVARHSTHTNPWPVWKNHGGTLARVLGTAPLAPDGSFFVEAPADRLLHFQVLDSNGSVVGNQLTWIYTRPGEIKGCVGCHEDPHRAGSMSMPLALRSPPLDFLPRGDEQRYRAKAWFKGHLPPDIERRTRTVRAVNWLAR